RHSASFNCRHFKASGGALPVPPTSELRMKIAELRERVRTAREDGANDEALRTWLERKLPGLHRSIRTREDAATTLFNFIQAHLEGVPDMLEPPEAVATDALLRAQLIPAPKAAAAFFLRPRGVISAPHRGLLPLLGEAYL